MADTTKVTLILTPVDLGKIDLLIAEGFYADRLEVIISAIHNQLDAHTAHIDRVRSRRTTDLGTWAIF